MSELKNVELTMDLIAVCCGCGEGIIQGTLPGDYVYVGDGEHYHINCLVSVSSGVIPNVSNEGKRSRESENFLDFSDFDFRGNVDFDV